MISFDLGEVRLRGDHNRQNARRGGRWPPTPWGRAAHRDRGPVLELVRVGVPNRLRGGGHVVGGRALFVNDSKATNSRLRGQGDRVRSRAACTRSSAAASRAAGSKALREAGPHAACARPHTWSASRSPALCVRPPWERSSCMHLRQPGAGGRAGGGGGAWPGRRRPALTRVRQLRCFFADTRPRGQRFRELVAPSWHESDYVASNLALDAADPKIAASVPWSTRS